MTLLTAGAPPVQFLSIVLGARGRVASATGCMRSSRSGSVGDRSG